MNNADLPFEAAGLRLRLDIALFASLTTAQAQELAEELSGHLRSPGARERMSRFMDHTFTTPGFQELLARAFGPVVTPLFEVEVERNATQALWLRLDLIKGPGSEVSAALTADADAFMASLTSSRTVRVLEWVGRKLLDKSEFERINDATDAQMRAEHLHQTTTTLFILLLDAAILELEAVLVARGHSPQVSLMCPGAPHPQVDLDLDEVRRVSQATQQSGPRRAVRAM